MERDFERIARLLTGNGIGLVLSSGGARGLAHIGVIRALEEEGIPIDMVGGTSQGSWICGMYAMGWDCKTMMTTVPEVIKKAGRPAYTLPMVSLLTGKTMSKALKMLFGEQQIEDLWLNYFCISANLTYGKMMVHQSGLLWKYVRASSAVPGILPPFVEGNSLLIDGVTVNNLPTDVMRKFIENGLVFASNILPQMENTEEELQQKEEYGDGLSGWRILWRRLNPFTKPINLPSIADIITLSMVLSNRNTVAERKKVTDFQVDLDVRPYGIFDYHAYETLVEMGYRAAQKNITEWKKNGQWARKGLERFSA
jgi:predicted acylesterase/phospholipase RssA